MIAAWMLYLLILSGLLCVAALSAERALRWLHRPVRATWALALLGAPLLAFVVARTGGLRLFGGAGTSSPGPASQLTPGVADPTSALGSWLSSVSGLSLDPVVAAWELVQTSAAALDRPLLYLWIAASAVVLLVLLISMRRLYATSREWPRRRVDGNEVLVSEGLGPAVLGIRRAEVVLPSWVLEKDPASRKLIVLHEAEHVKARDGALLFAGLLVAAAIPWNLLGWWQLRRLRLAVELDCDRRVLRSGVGLREYASLLLEAGSRRAVPFGSTAAFVHFDSQLGRRIRMMMENRKSPRYVPAAVALTMAAAILVVACTAPAPTETSEVVLSEQVPQAIAGKIVQKLRDGGTWTAHVEGEGELREITKVELNEMFGEGEGGEFHLRRIIEPDEHLELDESTGNWTLDEAGAYKPRQLKESHGNEVLGDEEVHYRTETKVRSGP